MQDPRSDGSPVSGGGTATRAPGGDPPLVFPQIARLELDDALDRLVQRAADVLATQSRLRALLHATRAVSGELHLPAVLRRSAEAARDLLAARWAAVAVLGPLGVPQLVDAEPAAALPGGADLLDPLLGTLAPVRRDDLTGDRTQAGDVAVARLLGVPVLVDGRLLGHLVVADDAGRAPFTAEDEELLVALAAATAEALARAEQHGAVVRRERWTAAAADLAAELGQGADGPLPLLASAARRAAVAALAVVLLPSPDDPDRLRVATAVGAGAGLLGDLRLPRGLGLAGLALERAGAVRVDDSGHALLDGALPSGPAVLLRLQVPGGAPGVLAVVRAPGSPPFEPDVTDLAAALVRRAEDALRELDRRRRAGAQELAVALDRVVESLQAGVVPRLFGLGLDLAGTLALAEDPAVRARLAAELEQLDAVVRALRSAVLPGREPAGR